MSMLLFLSKVAVITGDENLKEQLNKVYRYVDKKGCQIVTEVRDDALLVYDATNNEYLLRIHLHLDVDVNNMI